MPLVVDFVGRFGMFKRYIRLLWMRLILQLPFIEDEPDDEQAWYNKFININILWLGHI